MIRIRKNHIEITSLTLLLAVWVSVILPGADSKASPATGNAAQATALRLPYRTVLPGSPDQYEVLKMGGQGKVSHEAPWGQEYILQQQKLGPEGLTLECTAGRSAVPYKPWLLLRHIQTQKGLALSIAYPGNWRIRVARSNDGETQVQVDTLPANLEVFRTVGGLPIPGLLVYQFQGSWDEGALPITRFIRSHLLRKDIPHWPWVQYNTWYDHYEKIDEDRLLGLARKAAELGCEVFVVDAGWYGTAPDWSKALGDWRVNQNRLPRGIEPVAEEVRRLGMKFGMWIEIENASPDSPIGKSHPDWFMTRRGKRINERSTLHFGKPEVLAWAKAQIESLMNRYHLDYIKMDFNINPEDGGDVRVGGKDPLWSHDRGIVDLWTYMRKKYPRLVIENCASGSLRMDAAIAGLTDTHWVSDEVSDYRNLAMNYAMTYIVPPEICNHWTCFPKASPAMDLQSTFRITMLGEFGLSGSILEWSEETLRHAKEAISQYKELRPLIRAAEVYHLTPQVDVENPHTFQAAQYFVPRTGESLLFAFRANDAADHFKVTLRQIDPSRRYTIHHDKERREVKGKDLRNGLELSLPSSGSSALVRVIPL